MATGKKRNLAKARQVFTNLLKIWQELFSVNVVLLLWFFSIERNVDLPSLTADHPHNGKYWKLKFGTTIP